MNPDKPSLNIGKAWEKHHDCKTCIRCLTTPWWEKPCNQCCVIDFLDSTNKNSFWSDGLDQTQPEMSS